MDKPKTENTKTGMFRKLFGLTVLLTFLSALVYEFLTPILSDDLSYLPIVREATSYPDIVAQEVWHYFHHGGRSVAHLIMRFFMYTFDTDRRVFNVVAAVIFTLMTLLMLRLVRRGEEAEDAGQIPQVFCYLLIVLMVWLFAPVPGETIFWLTGTCNYLFTTTLILGFFALFFRFAARSAQPSKNRGEACRRGAALLVVGLLAGWCNENTSGGVVLFCLLMLVAPRLPFLWDRQEQDASADRSRLPLQLTALIGSAAGYIIQISAPGNYSRADIPTEEHEGVMRYAARFLKILAEIEGNFLPILLAILFLSLLCFRQGRKLHDPQMRNALLFFILFLATAFCLILAPEPQTRVYFGPGIFLMICCVQLFRTASWRGGILPAIRDFTVFGMLLVFLFTYVREGADLARLNRETNARFDMIREAMATQEPDADGDITVKLPQLPTEFDSRYSIACKVDITEDPWQFENLQISQFFADNVYVKGYPFDEFMAENAQ